MADGFQFVIDICRGSVCIDVPDLLRLHLGIVQGIEHHPIGDVAILGWLG